MSDDQQLDVPEGAGQLPGPEGLASVGQETVDPEAGRKRGWTPGEAFRATILHFTDDPTDNGNLGRHDKAGNPVQYFPDGLLVITTGGKVGFVGPFKDDWGGVPQKNQHDYRDYLVIPGFVETHIHSGQVDMLAAYSKQLISWLHNNVFPRESQFANEDYARESNRFFLNTLLAGGTTTASVFTTKHKHSADSLFQEASDLNMRILAGRVLMDNPDFTPDYLRDRNFKVAREETDDLIKNWHFMGRNIYSVPLRFALSSTDDQLQDTKCLMNEKWDRGKPWLHTHLAESREETKMVEDRFGVSGYLAAYEKFDLVRERTIFGHSLWITENEINRMEYYNAAGAFCPLSNTFLGGGLFQLYKFFEHGTRVGFGTDMGGGNGYSMLRVMEEAYKIVGLSNAPRCREEHPILPDDQRVRLSPLRAFYLATLGGARALHLDYKEVAGDGGYIGNFQPGKEADFVVLDWNATPTLRRRMEAAEYLHVDDGTANTKDEQIFLERLFALMMLGDERCTRATYVMGVKRYDRDEPGSEIHPWHDAGYRPPAVWPCEKPLSPEV